MVGKLKKHLGVYAASLKSEFMAWNPQDENEEEQTEQFVSKHKL